MASWSPLVVIARYPMQYVINSCPGAPIALIAQTLFTDTSGRAYVVSRFKFDLEPVFVYSTTLPRWPLSRFRI
jgi:hypothetical protein